MIRANGDVKFRAFGDEIDERYNGEYESGDKIRLELADSTYVKMKLDDTLAESIVYVPDGIFEFIIPEGVTTIGDSAFSGCDKLESIIQKQIEEINYLNEVR